MKVRNLVLLLLLPAYTVTANLRDPNGVPDAPPALEWKAAEKRDLGSAKDFVPHKVTFKKVVIDPTRGESCAVGEINGDGKLDIVGGRWWYRNPDWRRFEFRSVMGEIDSQGKGHELNGGDDLLDVDQDGDLDVISSHLFAGTVSWHENPGPAEVEKSPSLIWKEHLIAETGFIEFHRVWDIDGDGVARELLLNDNQVAWYRPDPANPKRWKKHQIKTVGVGHGMGVGDVNRDGQPDILTRSGWIEAPAREGEPWVAHSFPFGRLTAEIYALDLDGDEDRDLLASEGHGYGLYWAENVGPQADGGFDFKVHVIDASWSQLHTLELVDFDGDGDLDIFAGKRFFAHDGRDPGEYDPCVVVWYEKLDGAKWAKHAISAEGDVGTGFRIPVVDIDGDGDLDVVAKSKKAGLVLFINQSR